MYGDFIALLDRVPLAALHEFVDLEALGTIGIVLGFELLLLEVLRKHVLGLCGGSQSLPLLLKHSDGRETAQEDGPPHRLRGGGDVLLRTHNEAGNPTWLR